MWKSLMILIGTVLVECWGWKPNSRNVGLGEIKIADVDNSFKKFSSKRKEINGAVPDWGVKSREKFVCFLMEEIIFSKGWGEVDNTEEWRIAIAMFLSGRKDGMGSRASKYEDTLKAISVL